MPSHDIATPSPVDACPVCRARAAGGVSLYAPNGAVIQADNGHSLAPTVPLPDHVPAQPPALEPPEPEAATQTIQFWQGLAIGLGIAIGVLFLALLAA